MSRKTFWLFGMVFALSSVLVLASGHVQAQGTPNQVTKWDPTGSFAVDSAINETNGFVGVGGPNGSNSVVQIYGQDGLRISGFQPFLTLDDTNSGKIGTMQSASGNLYFYPDSFFYSVH